MSRKNQSIATSKFQKFDNTYLLYIENAAYL